ncbi:MAG: PepSY domain-containing protein [Candidatus Thermoplasmatota archaeon]
MTSGLTIAFSGDGQQGSSDQNLMDEDEDDDGDGDEGEEDEGEDDREDESDDADEEEEEDADESDDEEDDEEEEDADEDDGEDEGDDGDDEEDDEGDDDNEEDDEDEEDDDDDDERGVGSWNGTEGTFTSFELLENGIANYTLQMNNTEFFLFENVIIPDLVIEENETDGALYEIEGEDTDIKIYDVAPALMKIDAESDYESNSAPERDQLIGREEALDIAFEMVDGTLTDFGLEEDEESYIYQIAIVDSEEEHEIAIDAYSGEVLGNETGGYDEDEDETPEWDQLIGHEEALEIAYGIANGTLEGLELEVEGDEAYPSYEIEIVGEEKRYGLNIDGYTGEVLDIETENIMDSPRKVSFDLGNLEVVKQEGPNLILSYGNYTAKLLSVSEGEESWNESLNISIGDGVVNYTFEEDLFLVFRMTDFEGEEREREEEREMDKNITDGISQGKVGGEVMIDRAGDRFSDTSISYADMQMMTQVQENDRVRVTVSSNTLGEEGKILAITIYKEVLNADSAEELELTFDEKEIDMADDYEDLTDSSEGAEYLISTGSEKIEVLVMVPHFSTHSIEIARAETDIGSLVDLQYYLPVVAIMAIIVLATVWFTKKEK